MYTIGEVSKMFDIPISTLRYYDKEGLFPNIKRKSNIRYFDNEEIEPLRVIECLKKSELEIKDIKKFFDWCKKGPSTFEKRKELFVKRRKIVRQSIKELEKALSMLEFKCWYYDQLIENEKNGILDNIDLNDMPDNIKKHYENAHK